MKFKEPFLVRLLLMLVFCIYTCSSVRIDGDMKIDLRKYAIGTWNKNNAIPTWSTNIKYHIKSSNLKPHQNNIRTAFHQLEEVTNCVKFTQVYSSSATSEMIVIQSSESGCWSHVGRQQGRPTVINLDLDPSQNCLDVKIIKHEISHSMGFLHEHQRPDRDGFVNVSNSVNDNLKLLENYKIWEENMSFRLYTPYDYFSLMHYYSSELHGRTIITPHNQHYKPMMKHTNDVSIGDEIAFNLHFNCPITSSQFSRYMQFFEYYLHQELRQLDIKVDKASQRSFLLNPYRIFIETFEDAKRMHPKLAGEYRRKYSREGVPLWKHTKFEMMLIYSNNRWTIRDIVKNKKVARSEDESRMLTNEEWSYLNIDRNRWVIGNGDIFLNLYPEHEQQQDHRKCPDEWLDYGGEFCYHTSSSQHTWFSAQEVKIYPLLHSFQ